MSARWREPTKEMRWAAMNAITDEDRCFVLGYLAISVPGAVDFALAALASTLVAGATAQPGLPDQGGPPDPV